MFSVGLFIFLNYLLDYVAYKLLRSCLVVDAQSNSLISFNYLTAISEIPNIALLSAHMSFQLLLQCLLFIFYSVAVR